MIKNIYGYVLIILSVIGFTSLALKACDTEYQNDLNKQRQWVQDSKDGKAFTNYGE